MSAVFSFNDPPGNIEHFPVKDNAKMDPKNKINTIFPLEFPCVNGNEDIILIDTNDFGN